jgi:hypothetical protein
MVLVPISKLVEFLYVIFVFYVWFFLRNHYIYFISIKNSTITSNIHKNNYLQNTKIL